MTYANKKKGQTCAKGLKINPIAQVCSWVSITFL